MSSTAHPASSLGDAVAATTPPATDTIRAPTRPLLFLAFTEAWERFSYYGMGAILALYMSQALFLPGRIDGIVGASLLDLLRRSGATTPLALASQVYGLYAGFIYFTPVLGGTIADRLIGRRRAVVLGASLLSAGHFAMAFDASFLLALALLVVGCGLLKGNISAQVGALYPPRDDAGRTRGFAIFSMAINSGAILGPLAVAGLAQGYGWHAGFALAGVLMLAGLATYVAGYRFLPADPPRRMVSHARPGDGRLIVALSTAIALTIFQSVAYLQNSNIGLVWIAAHVDLGAGGFRIPVGWFNALDPVASIAGVPLLIAWWRRHPSREITRIAQGAAIAAIANLVLMVASVRAGSGGTVSLAWPIAYELLLGTAFLFYWPTLLALVSRVAPARVNATMLGCVFLSLFVAGLAIGVLGSRYETMGPVTFWAINAGIAATGAVLALMLDRPLTRALARGSR